jgi:ABC-type uncharacterized transport system permease subunit
VDWFTDRHLFLLAVIIYGACMVHAVFMWRKGFRQHDHASFSLLLAGLAFHTSAMIKRGFSFNQCPVNNLFEATLFLAWGLVIACLVVSRMPRLGFVSTFASAVIFAIGVFALMPSLDPPHGPAPEFSGGLKSFHAASVMLAYGAFGLAAVAAIMFLTQQHNLKFNKLRAVTSLLPPVQRLEFVANRLVLVGLVLFCTGLYAGGHLPRPDGVLYWKETKVLWSALMLALYLGLLLAHWKWAMVGRRFACGVIGLFAFLLLTFWGTNLLSTLHHP